jgi:hypothetical protein
MLMNGKPSTSHAGAHVPLEPSALQNGIVILRSAMDHGFIAPIDISPEQFHPDLQSTARIIKDATEAGSRGFSEILMYLISSTKAGPEQDLARAKISEYGDGAFGLSPDRLANSATIVREYHLVKSRVLAGWKVQKILEQGGDPSEAIRELAAIQTVGSESLTSRLTDRAFDFDSHPPKPIPLIQLCEMPLCTPGNIMNIQALPKAGKSAVMESQIAAIFNGKRYGPDTLGFSAENPQGKALVHFDTEQSRFDHDALIRRAARRAGTDRTPEWFVSYSVADLDIRDRRLALRHVMKSAAESHGGIFAVMIDGIGDLCGDPNDSEESFDLVHELHALAITHDCSIITVLHENPGSESGKTRGHLGSQLERKAETNLRLAKDAAGITTIWAERARHCYLPKDQGPCFSWNDQAGMHTSCGTAGEIKSAAMREKLQDEAERSFGEESAMSYSDLAKAIRDALEVSERTAKARIKTWLAEGITRKDSTGNHRLQIS